MNIDQLLEKIRRTPESVEFSEVMQVINEYYQYTPTRFVNGTIVNEAGENEGSCKIFAFASMHDLDREQTLACFGAYYRDDVLKQPKALDHKNIRIFMASGWDGIEIDKSVLCPK